jgi:hypothetical protein
VPAQRVIVTARGGPHACQGERAGGDQDTTVEREPDSADRAEDDHGTFVACAGIGKRQCKPARGELGEEREREDGESGRGALARLVLDLATHGVEAKCPAEQPERAYRGRGEGEHSSGDGPSVAWRAALPRPGSHPRPCG